MDVDKVQLKDKTVINAKIASFIAQCIGQINGFPGTNEALKSRGLLNSANEAYKSLQKVWHTKSPLLDLSELNSNVVKRICKIVIDNLNDYQDLETIMVVKYSEALKLINKI